MNSVLDYLMLSIPCEIYNVISSASPFSNYPMQCDLCSKLIWRFDFEKHYELDHKGQTCPPDRIVSKEEEKILNAKTQKAKPKMLKKDFAKLTDEELKLFSWKDFWNPTKHAWATGEAGRYGKQHSERLKKLFGAENFV